MGQFCKPTISLFVLSAAAIALSCNKSSDGEPSGPYNLSYGDSIIYLKAQSADYIVNPTEQRTGTYAGFPDGIEIDDVTGAINVSKSETGLRYRVTHTAPDGTVTTIKVVLSGITFPDKYYHLSQNDSIAFPVYNADVSRILPVTGSIFDEGNGANTGGCSVKTTNGQINLKETIRNGVFGSTPQNDVRKDFDIAYRLNDASGKAVNKIRVRLYYYERMSDVPADLLETLQDRADQGVFLRTTGTARIAKPRPPCVIIVNQ
ncbi:MAG: hypothetical protein JNN00_18035 [Chitinophagaceae bacterium]|nr:hypothetical protein [Chitinophagaceae bacterium]